MYRKTFGPWVIDYRNINVRRHLGFFSRNRLKVTNILFKKSSFVTWRSFSKARSPHMLDVISVSETFFKCVRNCGLLLMGMRIDHSAVQIYFMNRFIKYKSTFIKILVIYWKEIKECDKVNETFDLNLMNQLREHFSYT